MESVAVILNPNARRHRRKSAQRAERYQRIIGAHGRVYETRSLADVGATVRKVLDRDIRTFVVNGGDGSVHWVLNEARDALKNDADLPRVLPTNGGTIDFLAKKVGIRGNAESILRALVRRLDSRRTLELVELDSLELSGVSVDDDGSERPFQRIGFAVAAGGIGQRFFDKYYEEPVLGARAILNVVVRAVASYGAAQLPLRLNPQFLRYGRDVFQPTHARVTIDGNTLPYTRHGAIHAGAFDLNLDGVFHVFPLAAQAGVVHFQAGNILPGEIIRALPDLFRGAAIKGKEFTECAGVEMTIEALGDELLCPIIDGESFKGLKFLSVRAGPRVSIPRVLA